MIPAEHVIDLVRENCTAPKGKDRRSVRIMLHDSGFVNLEKCGKVYELRIVSPLGCTRYITGRDAIARWSGHPDYEGWLEIGVGDPRPDGMLPRGVLMVHPDDID